MKYPYRELIRMEDGKKAVELLFRRAQQEYVKLFKEMVEQEKNEHTLEKAFLPSKPRGTIFNAFTTKRGIEKNIELFNRTAAVLGESKVITTHQNVFFSLLFYKFCEDYKYHHRPTKKR